MISLYAEFYNIQSILKPYPHIRATTETRKDFDIDTIDKEV